MSRRPVLTTAGVLLLLVVLLQVFNHRPSSSVTGATTYSVARVQAGLRHDPAHWLGRTIFIHAVAEGRCGFPDQDGHIGNCGLAPAGTPFFGLQDDTGWTNNAAVESSLPLLLDPPPPEATPLHILHWLYLLPAARHDVLAWPQARSYRVHLRMLAPCSVEGLPTPCAVAELQL